MMTLASVNVDDVRAYAPSTEMTNTVDTTQMSNNELAKVDEDRRVAMRRASGSRAQRREVSPEAGR